MIDDQLLRGWWSGLDEQLQRRWLSWHPADAVPEELALQVRDHLPADVLSEYLFCMAEPDTGEVSGQWLATDRFAAAVEAARHEAPSRPSAARGGRPR
ncbi:hypothetical protein [Quadrisphaera sp. INWT6]|uniref:hypothetical protein n=1 Tax=Quadrisphaera sp. INWT6 TaxID=2596917 RepID=UPI0018924327|nr:hypothetical protein [Quadrisphaera sp. INWT6]MBF5080783.1 hypothetical protein [Quadrisphaera sp. INWT6]